MLLLSHAPDKSISRILCPDKSG